MSNLKSPPSRTEADRTPTPVPRQSADRTELTDGLVSSYGLDISKIVRFAWALQSLPPMSCWSLLPCLWSSFLPYLEEAGFCLLGLEASMESLMFS